MTATEPEEPKPSAAFSSNARLTPEQVDAIISDTRNRNVVASEYGIHPAHVSKLKRRVNIPKRARSREVAFWDRVDRSGGTNACWPWTGATYQNGYGAASYKNKPIKAHRLAFLLSNGRLTGGLVVMHSCDNPPCVNPSHLSEGTHADNVHDMMAKGRADFKTGVAAANKRNRRNEK